MNLTVVFNHIPRTGGTTLRIILNKVYGEDYVFFIKSKDILFSLQELENMDPEERKKFKVISGHGSNLFLKYIENPFRICVLREPVSMFISQYYYLRKSLNSNFLEDVRTLSSFSDYIDYAVEKGHDNMLTRFLSESHQWLIDQNARPIINDDIVKAKDSIEKYNAIFDLSNFDDGIFALSKMLSWNNIPLYKRSNKSLKQTNQNVTREDLKRVRSILEPDIELYNYFQNIKLDTSFLYKPDILFRLRQYAVNRLFG